MDLDPSTQLVYFLDDDAFHDTDRPGFRRRVVTGEHLQMCYWRITGGASGSFLHPHVDNVGEVYLAPREVWHGDSVFIGDEEYGECWILDVFSPPRDDLRAEG